MNLSKEREAEIRAQATQLTDRDKPTKLWQMLRDLLAALDAERERIVNLRTALEHYGASRSDRYGTVARDAIEADARAAKEQA